MPPPWRGRRRPGSLPRRVPPRRQRWGLSDGDTARTRQASTSPHRAPHGSHVHVPCRPSLAVPRGPEGNIESSRMGMSSVCPCTRSASTSKQPPNTTKLAVSFPADSPTLSHLAVPCCSGDTSLPTMAAHWPDARPASAALHTASKSDGSLSWYPVPWSLAFPRRHAALDPQSLALFLCPLCSRSRGSGSQTGPRLFGRRLSVRPGLKAPPRGWHLTHMHIKVSRTELAISSRPRYEQGIDAIRRRLSQSSFQAGEMHRARQHPGTAYFSFRRTREAVMGVQGYLRSGTGTGPNPGLGALPEGSGATLFALGGPFPTWRVEMAMEMMPSQMGWRRDCGRVTGAAGSSMRLW